MTTVRDVAPSDVPAVVELLEANMQSLASRPWGGSVDRLTEDVFVTPRVRIAVAAVRDGLAGMIAWTPGYDLHHCVRGGEICDLFVRPERRGLGIAPQLIAFACAAIASDGGVFVRGSAVPGAVPLYTRIAWGWDCREMILGGRAFRTIAELAHAPARTLARSLPDPAWNHQP